MNSIIQSKTTKYKCDYQETVQNYGVGVKRDITSREGEEEKEKCCQESRCSQKSCVFKSFLKEEGVGPVLRAQEIVPPLGK